MRAYKIPAEDGTVNTRMALISYIDIILYLLGRFVNNESLTKALRLPYGFVEILRRFLLQHQTVFTTFVILFPNLNLIIAAQTVQL